MARTIHELRSDEFTTVAAKMQELQSRGVGVNESREMAMQHLCEQLTDSANSLEDLRRVVWLMLHRKDW